MPVGEIWYVSPMRIHVTAVAGTGMGSLAGLLRSLGHEVSGSDVSFYPPMGPALREWDIRLFEGFSERHLSPLEPGDRPIDAVVIGNVCRKDNPEAVAADQLGIERLHIADALQRWVFPGTAPLVVTGTHGKTTTSSLCAHLLDGAGLDPGFLVGGVPHAGGRSFRAPGKRRLASSGSEVGRRATPFVIEGDEYDTAFWEKTPKFLHYRAQVAIVTSIEWDHVDIYPSAQAYEDAFAQFISGLPPEGLLVAHAGDPTVVRLAQQARCEVAYYAIAGEECHGVAPHWLAEPAQETSDAASFDLFAGGVGAGRFSLQLPGRHNLANATAALAACAQGYGTPLRSLVQPLATFAGVRRRQELVGRPDGISVYDDFAHHPTAVLATLRALRTRTAGRLFAVFEPRSATACRRLHQQEYETAFAPADVVVLAPVGRTDLPLHDRLDVPLLARRLDGPDRPAHAAENLAAIRDLVLREARPGDSVAVLSNGSFGGLVEQLLEGLGARSDGNP